MRDQADYEVKCYNAKGNLEIHTWHVGVASRDMEVTVARKRLARGELSRVEVFNKVAMKMETIYR
jgi:hypothetical protein